MTEEQALIATILAHPADDLPRKVYADWLDEHGFHERAEFIRVQCALAEDGLCSLVGRKMMDGVTPTDCGGTCDQCRLRERERELLEANVIWGLPIASIFFGADPRAYVEYGHSGCAYHHQGATKITWAWSRGFAESIRLPLSAFLGGSCERCGGSGWARYYHPVEIEEVDDCPACSGTGRTEGIAKRLFETQPVTRVEFTDREPFTAAGNFHYWPCTAKGSILESIEANRGHFASNDLPPELFDHIKGDNCDLPYMEFKSYDSPDLAVDAASDAAVALGRSLAKLGTLASVA